MRRNGPPGVSVGGQVARFGGDLWASIGTQLKRGQHPEQTGDPSCQNGSPEPASHPRKTADPVPPRELRGRIRKGDPNRLVPRTASADNGGGGSTTRKPGRCPHMAKAFSTFTLIRGREPLLRQVACEVRYHDGQLYLDRCGRLLKVLLGKAPEWAAAPGPTPQGTSAYNLRTGAQLGFSMASASLALDKTATDEVIDQAEVDEFLRQVDTAFALVLDELEVTE